MTAARTAGNAEARWNHLERAHIVSKPDPWVHTRNYVAMLALAVRQRADTPRATRAGRRRD